MHKAIAHLLANLPAILPLLLADACTTSVARFRDVQSDGTKPDGITPRQVIQCHALACSMMIKRKDLFQWNVGYCSRYTI